MTQRQIYGEVESKTDLRDVYRAIRKDIEEAGSREGLTELHRRAGYLVTLTYSPAWQEKWGGAVEELRAVADDEFARTARKVNARARAIGTDDDYDESWGGR